MSFSASALLQLSWDDVTSGATGTRLEWDAPTGHVAAPEAVPVGPVFVGPHTPVAPAVPSGVLLEALSGGVQDADTVVLAVRQALEADQPLRRGAS